MTLSTTIIVRDPIPPRPLFDLGVKLLASDPKVDWEPLVSEHAPQPGEGCWSTQMGQCLAAFFDVTYGLDGPLSYYGDEEPDWNPDPLPEWDKHCVRVWMDTVYGYEGPNGGHCGDLHVWLAGELCRHLDDAGARYVWWLDTWSSEHAQTTPDAPDEWGDPTLGRLA